MRGSSRKNVIAAGIVGAGLLAMSQVSAVAAPATTNSTPAPAPAGAADSTGSGAGATPVPSEEAEPGIAPPDAGETAVYLDSEGEPLSMDGVEATSAQTAADPCTPVSGRDDPHSPYDYVSGHGWWDKGNCSNDRADVYNCIYEYYTDGTWRQKACSETKRLKPRSWNGKRTNARRTCADYQLTSWRNHVDVDVVGEWDTGEQPYNQEVIDCRVY